MENLVSDENFWATKRVFVTGHTGFKGSWLGLALRQLGATVCGYALAPATKPSLFDLLNPSASADFQDIRDKHAVADKLTRFSPDIVLHLAAQALVRPSYADPVGTFETNIIGTANLLDAVRQCPTVRSVVIVTSDKCYENREHGVGYRESDHLGGHDPYSASKGAAEIVTSSMRASYFSVASTTRHPALIASVRAGNVIGGGDWSDDRLVPDIVRGCLGSTGVVTLRAPKAIRPWQHVLEPVVAYLTLARRLYEGEESLATAFNFGPLESDCCTVDQLASAVIAQLGHGQIQVSPQDMHRPHEAHLLHLDCTKARQILGWKPRLSLDEAIRWTADWYAAQNSGADMLTYSRMQLDQFLALDPG